MSYNKTKKLLQRYNTQYVYGERPSVQTQSDNRLKRKLLHRLEVLQELKNELPFTLSTHEQQQVETLIRRYNNHFKKLHGNASEKTIILAFIFFIKKADNPKINITQFAVATQNGLNTNTFLTITCRIAKSYMQSEPINDNRTYHYDNSILHNTDTPLSN